MPEDFLEIYARDWKSYLSREIHPAEAVLLDELREKWPRTRLLDLGIGAGRTTWFLSPLVDEYVGVDIVPRMIEECLKVFGENARRRFAVADARDLSQFGDASFDVVVFSYNGIDHLDHDARAQAFAEIRRVLSPGGVFFFSSHSLLPFPFHPSKAIQLGGNPLRWPTKFWRQRRNIRRFEEVNRIVQTQEVKKRGWVVLPDQAHEWGLHLYYSRPSLQKRELERAGFSVDIILNGRGKPVSDVEKPGSDWWFHYLCRSRA